MPLIGFSVALRVLVPPLLGVIPVASPALHHALCEPGQSVHDSPTKTWTPDFGLDLGRCLCDSFVARSIYFGSLAAT